MNFSNIKLANIAFQGTSRDVLNSEADLNSKDLPVSKPLKADEVLNSMDTMANTARIEIKGKGKPFHILKKRLYDPVVLENMVSNWSDEEKNIGCMPESWIRGLKKDEIGAKTKEVHKLFAEFARSISVLTSREYMQDAEKMISQLEDRLFNSGVSDEKINEAIDTLREYLKEDILKKCNDAGDKLVSDLGKIIQKECSIELLNNGMYGFAFKIRTDDEEFILKTYRPDALSILGRHGKTMDTANAAHLSSSMKPSQCARFYMGKIVEGSDPEGYSLNGFAKPNPDKQAAKDREMWFRDNKLSSSKYVFTDLVEIGSEIMDDNLIDGKLIDFGGVCYRFQNKKQQTIAKELYPMIKNGDKEGIKLLKEKYANSDDFNACAKRLILYGFDSILEDSAEFA